MTQISAIQKQSHVFVRLRWGARHESAATIATRMASTVALFSELHGVLAGTWLTMHEQTPAPATPGDWEEYVVESVTRADDGTPEERLGYHPSLATSRPYEQDDEPYAIFKVTAGSQGAIGNNCVLNFGVGTDIEPDVFAQADTIVTGLAQIWEPDYAALLTRPLNRAQGPASALPAVGLTTWVAQSRMAPTATPDNAVIEPWGEGFLIRSVPHDESTALSVWEQLKNSGSLLEAPAR